MKTTIIFVRHGETETNKNKKLHKSDDPKELNEVGRKQITKTAEELRKYSPNAIYSSKETRAIQSAEIISKICGVELTKVDGLEERNWGDFSGKTWPEIQAVLDKLTLEERYNYLPPNGESWKSFDERLKSKLDEILQENEGKTIIVVSHGGAIRALMPHLLGVPKEESFKYDPDNASITTFEYENGKFIKKIVNDTSHLVACTGHDTYETLREGLICDNSVFLEG